MSNLFIFSAITPLTIETDFNLSGATVTQILYWKPNGVSGAWDATVSGTDLVYNVTNGDIDVSGNWRLQAYVVIGGKSYRGAIRKQQFKVIV